jgi:hypothetical protein
MSELLGWNNPDQLTSRFIEDLRTASYGYANYQVAERILVDRFPPLADGFTYTSAEFLRCLSSRSGFHRPEGIDYHRLISDHNIPEKVSSGHIQEVWAMGFPWAGFFESRMAGPGAFWCNSPPLERTDRLPRRFVVMGFNFERGVGEMLESYGHRAESILEYTFRHIPARQSLWKRFTRVEKTHPGAAEVGSIHFAPNSVRDYDWGNPTPVLSRSRSWYNFPDLSSPPTWQTCAEWGNGDIRLHHLWWYRHLPHVEGMTSGLSNNWWNVIVDPNQSDARG